jgi:2-polyprenyl-3-methyl-5-hydroxy-6-metoxy-1,4-benzoquinol methylase/glycosyltransferase involved in cell wall biosynthesis
MMEDSATDNDRKSGRPLRWDDFWSGVVRRHESKTDVRFLEITDTFPVLSSSPDRPPWSYSLILPAGVPATGEIPLTSDPTGRSADEIVPQVFDEVLIHFWNSLPEDPIHLVYSLFRRGFIREKTFISMVFREDAVLASTFQQAREWLADAKQPEPSPHDLIYAFLEMLRFREIEIRVEEDPVDSRQDHDGKFLVAEALKSDFAEFMHERYIPGTWTELSDYEHLPRYLLASGYASGKRVLDFACGVGFGSLLMAENARSVLAVDTSKDAIEWGRRFYRHPNLHFAFNDDLATSLPPKSFDLAVCFEVIEHLPTEQQKTLVDSFRRLLTDDGLLLISTPNPRATELYDSNPFHLAELRRDEFESLLRSRFGFVAISEQRALSAVMFGGIGDDNPTFSGFFDAPASQQGHSVLNWVAACSKSVEVIPPSAVFLDPKSEVIQQRIASIRQLDQLRLKGREQATQLSTYRTLVSQQQEELNKYQAQAEALVAEKKILTGKIQQLEQQLKRREEENKQQDLALREARRVYHSITTSLSWRLTRPLRALRDAGAVSINKVQRRVNLPLSAAKLGLDPYTSHLATLIRRSEFFDVDVYEATAEARAQGLDPALHYVLVGEQRGIKPSPAFDPVYYGERYPDIAAWGGNRLGHYLETGKAEGRRALPLADTLTLPAVGIKADRPIVLILIHEASRTGAPILGWNIARALSGKANVVAVLMREGLLEPAFGDVAAAVVGPMGDEIFKPAEASRLAPRLAAVYQPLYAIANSVETRALAVELAEQGIPVIALAHEFSGYTKPAGSLQLLYERAAEVIFSADIVRRSSETDYPFLRLRRTHVLPQGQSEVPRSREPTSDRKQTETDREIKSRLRPDAAKGDLVVVGMGFVDWRKGVDLFIGTATSILAREPKTPVRFIWIGHGYRVVDALDVSCYLSEQVTRSHLADRFEFMDAVDDIESIYQEADILFLSSRLDPLPNVSIDATLRGIPVVCFAEASGMAEILVSNDETRELVVPHLDVGAAAALIGSLATDRDKLRRLGNAVRELARGRFDMRTYVAALDELGRRANKAAEQEKADIAAIIAAGAFDLPLYLGARAPFVELTAAVQEYSRVARKIDYERVPAPGAYTRRPLAGFNPVTYALQNPNYDARTGGNPLAHYLRAGRPTGPWMHPVFRVEPPDDSARPLATPDSSKLRIILHGHFHYTDHVDDFLRALAVNMHACELILTTNSAEKVEEIRTALKNCQAEADIRVVPNRGRDIGPFLRVLEEAIGNCDLLGHVHGKRSLKTTNVDIDFGDRWRTFLWQHLIGDEMPMVDFIKHKFAEDSTLGLIFPEDPHLIGWEENFEISQELATRMALRVPLPPNVDFPVGTMFWTRPEALAPLLRLALTWDDYPPEPLPIDGTMLHALERLLPLVAEDAGYHYATTYLPRFVR